MLAVMIVEGLGRHVRDERVLGKGKLGKNEGHGRRSCWVSSLLNAPSLPPLQVNAAYSAAASVSLWRFIAWRSWS